MGDLGSLFGQCISTSPSQTRAARLVAARPLPKGFRRKVQRRELQTCADLRDGRPDSADEVFRRAYESISADLIDELEDCAASATCGEERIRTSVAALVDFAAFGGSAADLWLIGVLDAPDGTRKRRTFVLDQMAQLVVSGPRTPNDAPAGAGRIEALFVLGGILDRLTALRRIDDVAGIRRAEPDLIAFAVAIGSALAARRT